MHFGEPAEKEVSDRRDNRARRSHSQSTIDLESVNNVNRR
jgi:hypothetical protein